MKPSVTETKPFHTISTIKAIRKRSGCNLGSQLQFITLPFPKSCELDSYLSEPHRFRNFTPHPNDCPIAEDIPIKFPFLASSLFHNSVAGDT
ncbi:hypothetical protein CEXT_59281 [Caerostris extrusa]|uniref:Uncharacterized protein n=1 Tax=Caerostris extrusa TaxID=172846 RepID=A0AAV4MDA7_CAEEX|nr:hypothetical protein CEXT_59281 [Caerostris extrusa]